MSEKHNRYVPGIRNFDEYYATFDEKKSLKETEEILKKFEEAVLNDIPVEELKKEYILRPVADPCKKQSSLTTNLGVSMKDYIYGKDENMLINVGDVIIHEKRGKGKVIKASCINDQYNVIVEYENGDQYEYDGSIEQFRKHFIFSTFNPGDVVNVKGKTDTEYVIKEVSSDGRKAKVVDKDGREKEVSLEHVELKKSSKEDELQPDDTKMVRRSQQEIKVEKIDIDDKEKNKIGGDEKNKMGDDEKDKEVKKDEKEETMADDVKMDKVDKSDVVEVEETDRDEGAKLWNLVIKDVLLEPDVAVRIVERIVDNIEENPEFLSRIGRRHADMILKGIDEVLPLIYKDTEKFYQRIAVLFGVADAEKEIFDIEFGEALPRKPKGLKETKPEVISELEESLRQTAERCLMIHERMKQLEEAINLDRKEAERLLEERLAPRKQELLRLKDELLKEGQKLGSVLSEHGVAWRKFHDRLMIVIDVLLKEKKVPTEKWMLEKLWSILKDMNVDVEEAQRRLSKAIEGYSKNEVVEHIKRIWFMKEKGSRVAFDISKIWSMIKDAFSSVWSFIKSLVGITDRVEDKISKIEQLVNV